MGAIKQFLLSHSTKFILAIFTGVIAAIIFFRLTPLIKGYSSNPYVAIVMSGINTNVTTNREFITYSQLSRDFIKGFRQEMKGASYLKTANEQTIKISFIDDAGNLQEARTVARRLLDDDNCILVIAGSNSTRTAAILDVFIDGMPKKEPPALIMPIATANELLVRANTAGYKAILRMPLPDSLQAAAIAQLVNSHLKKAGLRQYYVAIFADADNPTYSRNILRDIADNVRAVGGKVVAEGFIGPSDPLLTSASTWTAAASSPDFVIYAGEPHYAFLLSDQLAKSGVTAPILFSDGCMTEPLLKYASALPVNAFITFPVRKTEDSPLPSYTPIGRDAVKLTKLLLDKVPYCSRAGIARLVWDVRTQSDKLMEGDAGVYGFSNDGENNGMSYQAFRIVPAPKFLVLVNLPQ